MGCRSSSRTLAARTKRPAVRLADALLIEIQSTASVSLGRELGRIAQEAADSEVFPDFPGLDSMCPDERDPWAELVYRAMEIAGLA